MRGMRNRFLLMIVFGLAGTFEHAPVAAAGESLRSMIVPGALDRSRDHPVATD